MTQNTGREDLGVVGDDEIIFGEQIGKVIDMVMGNVAGLAIDEHESG